MKITTNALFSELLELQVRKTPNQIAFEYGEGALTYGELNEKANRIAHYLRDQGVVANSVVGLLMNPSMNVLIGIVGILKAGGTYVTINTTDTKKQCSTIIDDSRVEILLIDKGQIEIANDLIYTSEYLKTYLCLDTEEVEHYVDPKHLQSIYSGSEIWDYVAENATNNTNASGWVDSYVNKEFSAEEIEDLVQNVIQKVSPYISHDSRVLEIGCGSGLIMYDLAPKVGHFCGTDISTAIIQRNAAIVKEKNLMNVDLRVMAAHEIENLKGKPFDVIIMNSVIQYFPGINYLKRVIRGCMDLLSDHGVLFIGDIRNVTLQRAFYESLFEDQNMTVSQLEKSILQKYNTETELFISPKLFEEFESGVAGIKEVVLSAKAGRIENELTRYRFDALIKLDKSNSDLNPNPVSRYQHDLRNLADYSPANPVIITQKDDYAYCMYLPNEKLTASFITHEEMIHQVTHTLKDLKIQKKEILVNLRYGYNTSFNITIGWKILMGGRLGKIERMEVKRHETE